MLTATIIQELSQILPADCVKTDDMTLTTYSTDKSRHTGRPDAVVFVETEKNVSDVVQFCYQHAIPLIARGLGSGMPGGCIPTRGGIVLSLERMTQIIKFDVANRVMIVQAGITNAAVQEAAAQQGLFWPPDPGSAAISTIGGNLAFNAAGPHAVKYGTPRENTLGLRAVIGTGETIKTGVYTTKGVVGYDLTRLLICSEGTLGIITEATLKLTPLPETKRTLRILYKDIRSAISAVVAIMGQSQIPAALEFMDGHAIKMIQAYYEKEKIALSPFNYLPAEAEALLLIELDGSPIQVEQAAQTILKTAKNSGTLDYLVAKDEAESAAIWEARRHLSPALKYVAPNKINEDIVVPVTALPELIDTLDQFAKHYQFPIVNFGHAGNGNLHVNIMYNAQDPIQNKHAEECLPKIFALALKLNGSLSGEHGVAMEKRAFIQNEIDAVSLRLMREIKQAFDPKGILNPDKIF